MRLEYNRYEITLKIHNKILPTDFWDETILKILYIKIEVTKRKKNWNITLGELLHQIFCSMCSPTDYPDAQSAMPTFTRSLSIWEVLEACKGITANTITLICVNSFLNGDKMKKTESDVMSQLLEKNGTSSQTLHKVKDILRSAQRLTAESLTTKDVNLSLSLLSDQVLLGHNHKLKKKKGKNSTTFIDGNPVTTVSINENMYFVKGNMINEGERYITYLNESWPKDCPISPSRLAKAGFYYIGEEDTVQCFVCKGRINNWEYGDSAMGEHKRLYPKCNFVRGLDTKNIPLEGLADQHNLPTKIEPQGTSHRAKLDEQSEVLERLQKLSIKDNHPEKDTIDFYKKESNRLHSFNSWPMSSPVDPFDLAATGFYLLGGEDIVQCFACFGKIQNWKQGDKPKTEHKRSFPNCAFVMGLDVGNVQMTADEKSQAKRFLDDREPPLRMPQPISGYLPLNLAFGPSRRDTVIAASLSDDLVRNAKYPQYSFEQERLYTFRGWPLDSATQPAFVARAGFFYTGKGDEVKCFFCGGGLKEWTTDDEPWEEHARWYPKCEWLLQQRGPAFVDYIHRKYADESTPYQPSLGIPVDRPQLQSNLPSIISPPPSELALSPATFRVEDESGIRTASHVQDQLEEEASLQKQRKTGKKVGGKVEKSVDEKLEEVLRSDIVQFILEMGNDEESVRSVLRNRLEAGDVPYDTSEELLSAVFTEQTKPKTGPPSTSNYSTTDQSAASDESVEDKEIHSQGAASSEVLRQNPMTSSGTVEGESFPLEEGHAPQRSSNGSRVSISQQSEQGGGLLGGEYSSSVPLSLESRNHQSAGFASEFYKTPSSSASSGPIILETGSFDSEAEELKKLRDKQLCKICLDKDVEVLFTPCFHLVACESCAEQLIDCPICRKRISHRMKIFMA